MGTNNCASRTKSFPPKQSRYLKNIVLSRKTKSFLGNFEGPDVVRNRCFLLDARPPRLPATFRSFPGPFLHRLAPAAACSAFRLATPDQPRPLDTSASKKESASVQHRSALTPMRAAPDSRRPSTISLSCCRSELPSPSHAPRHHNNPRLLNRVATGFSPLICTPFSGPSHRPWARPPHPYLLYLPPVSGHQ